MFKTEFNYDNVSKCIKHPTYKVMRKPTANCKHCLMLWDLRNKQRG